MKRGVFRSYCWACTASLLCLCLFVCGCNRGGEQSVDRSEGVFSPTEEFRESYEPIKRALEAGESFDIEKTVRVMYALEQLQAKEVSLRDFLRGLSRLNQEGVAPEILKSEERMLSIFQDMRQIEESFGEEQDLALYHSIVNAARRTGNQIEDSEVLGDSASDAPDEVSRVSKDAVSNALEELDGYLDKRSEIREEYRSRIREVEKRYLDFLLDYATIRERYLKEWDSLCIEKDRIYIDVYNGHYSNAFKTANAVLARYPENRETLILKALSATMLGMSHASRDALHLAPLSVAEFGDGAEVTKDNNETSAEYFRQASETLDFYLKLYPDYSAPALALKGMIALCLGEEQEGISFLSKASIEYPRQSEKLSEMFELYSSRSYLNKTHEGKYVLRLYRSTMEGYGMFSPNFIKAGYYSQCKRDEDSRREIFNHFFRRGNQEVYHCLLSDMQFCEQFIGGSFKKMFPESSFFDIETSGTLIGNNKIKVTFNNRTNIALQNVRVFLCLHLVDMYPNEYEIVKVPTKNLVPAMQKTSLETVEFNYEGKTYDDIAHIRAIVMTDDSIFWCDGVDYKLTASKNGALVSQPRDSERIDRNLFSFGFDLQSLQSAILDKIAPLLVVRDRAVEGVKKLAGKLTSMVTGDLGKKWYNSDGKLKFVIPRELMLLDPSFALKTSSGEMIYPEVNYIDDRKIRLLFDVSPVEGEKCALYIYTKNVSCRLILQSVDQEMQVVKSTIF